MKLILAIILLLVSFASGQTTQMVLGVNVDNNTPDTNPGQWVNLSHGMSNWFNGSVDINGYPLTNGSQCRTSGLGCAAGTYKCTWVGQVTLAAKSLGSGQVTLTSTGPNSADLIITAPNNQFFFTATNLNGTFGNFQIIAPNYVGSTKTFRTEFTKWLAPFTTVRMIDWSRVNSDKQAVIDAYANKTGSNPATTQPVSWSSRVQPSNWDQVSKGVAYEYQMQLAIETGSTWWVNIPYMADEAYISALADLIATAPSNLKIKIEVSNEDWNSGFGQWLINYTIANGSNAMTWDGDISTGTLVHYPNGQLGTDSNTRAARCYADRARTVSYILRKKLGAHRFQMVLGGQCMWTFWLQAGLDWVQARYGDVDRAYDCIAIGPYFPINLPAQNTPITVMASQADTFIKTDLDTAISQHKTLANKYGLILVCYEGGQNYYPWFGGPPFAANDLPVVFQTDPLMGVEYDAWLAVCAKYCSLTVHNSFIRPWVNTGLFALQQNMLDAPGLKYNSLAKFAGTIIPPQPAVPYNGNLGIGGITYPVNNGLIYTPH